MNCLSVEDHVLCPNSDSVSLNSVDLDAHLARNMVDYLQFAFQWMNNLLMREFPLN